jgi:hypothetical protein
MVSDFPTTLRSTQINRGELEFLERSPKACHLLKVFNRKMIPLTLKLQNL